MPSKNGLVNHLTRLLYWECIFCVCPVLCAKVVGATSGEGFLVAKWDVVIYNHLWSLHGEYSYILWHQLVIGNVECHGDRS